VAEIAQYQGTGKRKTSVARVILRPGDGGTWINGRTIEDYFPRPTHRKLALAPLEVAGLAGAYDLRVRCGSR
jgi:small subunit ribosomal protein S9